ncbi:MAG: hypothetical protein WCY88_12340 [Spongiibacteraceae bacterium]
MLEEDKATPVYASLIVTSLPHRQPIDGESPAHLWRRRIGNDEYLLESGFFEDGSMTGIPFGAKARLAPIYIHTQMIRQASSVLDVPHTRNAFLKALNMPDGGYELQTRYGSGAAYFYLQDDHYPRWNLNLGWSTNR